MRSGAGLGRQHARDLARQGVTLARDRGRRRWYGLDATNSRRTIAGRAEQPTFPKRGTWCCRSSPRVVAHFTTRTTSRTYAEEVSAPAAIASGTYFVGDDGVIRAHLQLPRPDVGELRRR
jgi:hypothetical protein